MKILPNRNVIVISFISGIGISSFGFLIFWIEQVLTAPTDGTGTGFGTVVVSDIYGSGPSLTYTWDTSVDENHWTGTAATNPNVGSPYNIEATADS